MKYYAVDICPKLDSGLCNQLYALVTSICYCIDNEINILFIDKFYKSINTNNYCVISDILNLNSINLYLSKYSIFLVDSKNFLFNIESANIIDNNSSKDNQYDITNEIKNYLKDNILNIPYDTYFDIPFNSDNIHLEIKYFINNGFFEEKYIIKNNTLITDIIYDFNNLTYNIHSVCGNKHKYFWDILVNIEFTDKLVNIAKNIKNQIINKNNQLNNKKINCIHLRLENDFIEHLSNQFFKNKDKVKCIFENEYIKTIKNHIEKNEETIVLTSDLDNNVIKYLIENNYNFLTIPKLYDDREINAVIDLEVGTICNNILIIVYESSFSYSLWHRVIKNDKKIKLCHLIFENLL